jgi:hypothetical protein
MHMPACFAAVILPFAPVFVQQRVRCHAELLLIGAVLAPGRRTVTSLLRIAGLGRERRFTNYHRVLNRVIWSPRAASRILLGLLLDAFAPTGPVVLGIDDTIEPRRGRRINAKGIHRDPVRSSDDGCLDARSCAGGRQQLRRPGLPGGSRRARAGLRHSLAAGRGAVRTGADAPARDGRAPADQGCAPA